MSETTPIEWTDATWSPWEGCTKVGLGCDHCYAEAMNNWLRKGANWGPGAPRREYSDAHWAKPLKWNAAAAAKGERMRVFPSVCDPFDNEVDPAWRARFFALIRATPHLDWLLLTKRIGNAAEMSRCAIGAETAGWPWRNIWLGATVVNQEEADRDIPKLLATRARARFLSIEPMLGPVDITPFLWGKHESVDSICQNCPRDADCECGYHTRAVLKLPALHWAIVGGESGRGARSMVLGWTKEIVRACKAAGVPVMVKQLGAKPTNREGVIHVVSGKGGDMAEWPIELRVREFPEAPCAT
jgi:protein gp37